MTPHATKLRSLLALAAGPIAVFALGASSASAPPVDPPRREFRFTKCPGHGADSIAPLLSVPGEITNVPEYHDCQRFIIRRSGAMSAPVYDSVYGIFASDSATVLMDRLKRLECAPPESVAVPAGGAVPMGSTLKYAVPAAAPRGSSVTDSANTTNVGDCRTDAKKQYTAVGVAFAEVLSAGGKYRPLWIEPGVNCLYLWDSAHLKAFMRHVQNETDCLQAVARPDTYQTKLNVRRIQRDGLSSEDYPPVARWDRQGSGFGQYISMYCQPFWCEIGPGAFVSSSQYASPASDHKLKRVVEIKGWYDEQILSHRNAAGRLVPSGIKGTLIPNPNLGDYRDADFAIGTWLPVANVVISAWSEKYRNTWNLEPSGLPFGTNQVFLCQGTAAQCIPTSAGYTPTGACTYATGEQEWYSKTVSSSGQVKYKCVKRALHTGLHAIIPGTVRWRWLDIDEGEWVRCPSGCCYPN